MESVSLSKLKDVGPWVLGAVALAQVWVIALWKRLRKGKIEIHESENIQVGYGAPGLSLALKGTLRIIRQDVFLKRMEAKVTRKKDGATHVLRWAAFLSGTRIGGGSPNQALEPVWSFPIKPTDIYRYNVFFSDPTQIADQQGKLDQLTRSWGDFVRQKVEAAAQLGAASDQIATNPALSEALFQDFLTSKVVADTYGDIDRAMVWQPGDYALELSAWCADPERAFRKAWTFCLSEDDVRNLRSNAIATLRAACGLPKVFTFAYPVYEGAG